MKDVIDPTEIETIKSNSPITMMFTDGSSVTAYNFEFKNLTHYADNIEVEAKRFAEERLGLKW